MAVTHSPEIHAQLLARIPSVTGRDLHEWFDALDKGPSLTRCSERSAWLADEYELSRGYAHAIVQEYMRRHRSHQPIPRQRA